MPVYTITEPNGSIGEPGGMSALAGDLTNRHAVRQQKMNATVCCYACAGHRRDVPDNRRSSQRVYASAANRCAAAQRCSLAEDGEGLPGRVLREGERERSIGGSEAW